MMELLFDPPFWLWVSIAATLLLLEVNLGTFDLLWLAAGAGLTGLLTQAPFTPSGPSEWLIFIAITAALTVGARTAGFKKNLEPEDKRALNSGETWAGRSAVALQDFADGAGRVRLGDTDWTARLTVPATVREGDMLRVQSASGTELIVEKVS